MKLSRPPEKRHTLVRSKILNFSEGSASTDNPAGRGRKKTFHLSPVRKSSIVDIRTALGSQTAVSATGRCRSISRVHLSCDSDSRETLVSAAVSSAAKRTKSTARSDGDMPISRSWSIAWLNPNLSRDLWSKNEISVTWLSMRDSVTGSRSSAPRRQTML